MMNRQVILCIISLLLIVTHANNTVLFKHDGIIVGKSKKPNAGIGLIVTKHIKQGQILLIEQPLYQIHRDAFVARKDAKILENHFSKLSPDIQTEIRNLGSSKWTSFADKYFAYAYNNGLFKLFCLINHGYPANIVSLRKVNQNNSEPLIVVASTDLYPDDELQFDYLNFIVVGIHALFPFDELKQHLIFDAKQHHIDHTIPEQMWDDLKYIRNELLQRPQVSTDDLISLYVKMLKYYSNGMHQKLAVMFAATETLSNLVKLDVDKYFFVVHRILEAPWNKLSNDMLQKLFHLWFTDHGLMKSLNNQTIQQQNE